MGGLTPEGRSAMHAAARRAALARLAERHRLDEQHRDEFAGLLAAELEVLGWAAPAPPLGDDPRDQAARRAVLAAELRVRPRRCPPGHSGLAAL